MQLNAQVPSGSGNAVSLDGVDDFVSLANLGTMTLPVSVSLWFNPQSAASEYRIFYSHNHAGGGYQGFWLQYLNGTLNVAFGDGTAYSQFSRNSGHGAYSFQVNRWYHLTGVIHSATNMELYVNGNPLTITYSGSGSPVMSTNSSNGTLGMITSGSGSSYLNAVIDELSVWDRALTQQEVRDLMCRKLTGNEPGLEYNYRFDHSGGTNVSNTGTTTGSGTMMNGAAWIASSAPVGDRSTHNYTGANPAIGFSLSGDSISITPGAATVLGTHLYLVDVVPSNTNGVVIPPGIDYYFGVFNASYTRSYQVELLPGPVTGSFPVNNLLLAERPDNAASPWTFTTASNNPDFQLPGQIGSKQFVISEDPCLNFDVDLGNDTTICNPLNFSLGRPMYTGETYLWSTGDTIDSIQVNNGGIYWLQVTRPGCVESDTVNITLANSLQNFFPSDSTACDSLTLELTGPYSNFLWSDGDTSSVNTVNTTGKVWVVAIDTITGCQVSDSIDIFIVSSSTTPSLTMDTIICGNDPFTLDVTTNGAIGYLWSDGDTSAIRTFVSSGIYWVERNFPGGCKRQDTIQITFSVLVNPIVEDEFFLCNNDSVEIQIQPASYTSITWSNGASGLSADYTNPGVHWVVAVNSEGCEIQDTFEIKLYVPLDSVRIFNDTSLCVEKGLYLIAPEGLTVTWNGSGPSDTIYLSASANMFVEISDGCTNKLEYFKVEGYTCECKLEMPNAFTPNNDGLNEYYGVTTHCEFLEFELSILNRWGQNIFTTRDNEIQWNGMIGSELAPTGVYIYHIKYRTPHTSGTKRGHFSLLR